MLTTIGYYISIISSFSMLLPFIGVFYMISTRRKELIDKEIFIFSSYILLITLAQFLISLLAFNCMNNIFLFHIFMPIELSLFSLILLLPLIGEKNAYLIAAGLFVGAYIFTYTHDLWHEYPAGIVFVNNVFLVGIMLMCFLNFIKTSDTNKYRMQLYRGMMAYILGNILSAVIFQTHFYEALIIHNLLNVYANIEFSLIYKKYGAK